MSPSPLRILTVADTLCDPNSGAAGTVYYTNQALRQLGHEVDEIWADDLGPRRIAHGNLHSLLEQPIQYLKSVNQRKKKSKYDLIIAQQPQSYLASLFNKFDSTQASFFVMSQGVETRINPIIQNYQKSLKIQAKPLPISIISSTLQGLLSQQWFFASKFCHGFIVQHSEDKFFLRSKYRLPSEKILVCPSGVPDSYLINRVCLRDSKPLNKLLFVGQFAFYKGCNFLVSIVTNLLSQRDYLKFTWVCKKSDHSKIKKLFPTDILPRIRLMEWQDQSSLMSIYGIHDIFVFPTIAEGFAKAPLEAMSRGMCVVASDCCGMKDYIEDRKSGYLCQVGNVNCFTDKVLEILDNQELFLEISRNAVVEASSYTWTSSATAIINFFENIKHKG
jgi:glycosyltransferase involved in cell wall biosynthesis